MKEAKVVCRLSVPACVDSSIALQPSKQALDLPASFVTTQLASIDLAVLVPRLFWRDELDVARVELVGELLTAEALVADQFVRDFVKRFVDYFPDEDAVVLRPSCDANGDRKTSAVCNRHDLCRKAGTTSSDFGSPFLAPA